MGQILTTRTYTCAVALSLFTFILSFSPFWASAQSIENLSAPVAKPELVLQVGHRMMVTSVATTSDGNTLATGSWDGTVKLWDRRTGEIKRTLVGSNAAVNSVALAVNSPVLASGGGVPATHDTLDGPGDARVWNSQTGKLLRTFTEFAHPVSHVALSADGKTLVTISYQDQPVADTSKQPPMGESLYRRRQQAIAAQIKWWDVETGRILHTLVIPSSSVTAFTISADGETLAIGTTAFKDLQVTSRDKNGTTSQMRFNVEIRLCDFQSGTVRSTLTLPNSQLNSLAISPDGRTLATGHSLEKIGKSESYGPIRLWDIANGKVTAILQTPDDATGDWGDVAALAFSPDGKTLAAAKQGMGGVVQLWNLATEKIKQRIAHTAAMDQMLSMAFLPQTAANQEMPLITVGGHLDRGTVRVWEANSKSVDKGNSGLLWEKVGLNHSVDKVAFAPDGSAIATTFSQVLLGGPTDNPMQEGKSTADVKLWDAKTLTLQKTLPDASMAIYDITFSPDSHTIATSTFGDAPPPIYTQGRIRLWDIKSGKINRTITAKDIGGYSLSFAPHGRTIATANGGEITSWDTVTGKKTRTYRAGPFSPGDLTLFAPDGRTLIGLGGHSDANYGMWAAWDTATGKTLWSQDNEKLYSGITAFAPDSRLIATGDSDGKVRLREARTGKVERVLAMGPAREQAPSTQPVMPIKLAFSPDGKILACAGADNSIRLWDTATYAEPAVIPADTLMVDIDFSPNSKSLAALTRDGRLCLWEVGKRQLKATTEILAFTTNKQGFGSTTWITYTPDSYYVASPGAASYIRWRTGDKLEPAAGHASEFEQPDLVKKELSAD